MVVSLNNGNLHDFSSGYVSRCKRQLRCVTVMAKICKYWWQHHRSIYLFNSGLILFLTALKIARRIIRSQYSSHLLGEQRSQNQKYQKILYRTVTDHLFVWFDYFKFGSNIEEVFYCLPESAIPAAMHPLILINPNAMITYNPHFDRQCSLNFSLTDPPPTTLVMLRPSAQDPFCKHWVIILNQKAWQSLQHRDLSAYINLHN